MIGVYNARLKYHNPTVGGNAPIREREDGTRWKNTEVPGNVLKSQVLTYSAFWVPKVFNQLLIHKKIVQTLVWVEISVLHLCQAICSTYSLDQRCACLSLSETTSWKSWRAVRKAVRKLQVVCIDVDGLCNDINKFHKKEPLWSWEIQLHNMFLSISI